MDPRVMALLAALQGQGRGAGAPPMLPGGGMPNQAQGPMGRGMPMAAPPSAAMSMPGAAGAMPPPVAGPMPATPGEGGAGAMLQPKSTPGALLSAAGMQPQPTDMAASSMRGPEIPRRDPNVPQRQGDFMGPVHPTYDEPTTPIAPPIQQALPILSRTPLGALLIPGMLRGGPVG